MKLLLAISLLLFILFFPLVIMGYLFLSDQYSYNDQTFVWAHSLRLSSQTQPFIADSITIISNYLRSEILSSIENMLGKHTEKKKKAHLLKLHFETSIMVCIIKCVIWSQTKLPRVLKLDFLFFFFWVMLLLSLPNCLEIALNTFSVLTSCWHTVSICLFFG